MSKGYKFIRFSIRYSFDKLRKFIIICSGYSYKLPAHSYKLLLMKIIPLADRVVIEPLKDEGGKTKTGIYLPETVDKERPEQGKVIAVGPGKLTEAGKRVPVSVKKGDKVVFTKYGPNEVKVDDKEYLIAREEDILAILE